MSKANTAGTEVRLTGVRMSSGTFRMKLVAGAMCCVLRVVLQFENAADLKFFGGFPFIFDLQSWLFPSPDEYVEASCDSLEMIWSSQVPILFRSCIDEKLRPHDLAYLNESVQNLFPVCQERLRRNFEFVGLDGESTPIVEEVPCANTTLRSKFEAFTRHQAGPNSSYLEVHTYMLNKDQEESIARDLRAKSVIPDTFRFRTAVTGLTYFFSSRETAVYYLHAHMDKFLSFNLGESKHWELASPRYMDNFDGVWSGNAMVLKKELVAAPRVFLEQRRGDILFVPPWWIHKTRISEGRKTVGFNMHILARGQALGHAAELMNYFGWTSYFFRNAASTPGTAATKPAAAGGADDARRP